MKKNVKNAFIVKDIEKVIKKKILLFDDIRRKNAKTNKKNKEVRFVRTFLLY